MDQRLQPLMTKTEKLSIKAANTLVNMIPKPDLIPLKTTIVYDEKETGNRGKLNLLNLQIRLQNISLQMSRLCLFRLKEPGQIMRSTRLIRNLNQRTNSSLYL